MSFSLATTQRNFLKKLSCKHFRFVLPGTDTQTGFNFSSLPTTLLSAAQTWALAGSRLIRAGLWLPNQKKWDKDLTRVTTSCYLNSMLFLYIPLPLTHTSLHTFISFYHIFSEAKGKENINKNDSLSYLEKNLIWRITDDLFTIENGHRKLATQNTSRLFR